MPNLTHSGKATLFANIVGNLNFWYVPDSQEKGSQCFIDVEVIVVWFINLTSL